MRKSILFFLVALLALGSVIPGSAIAGDKDKIKVTELLEDVNKVMSEAQKVYVDGDGDKAVKLYRQALTEIKKIEARYPGRVNHSDFAPLRFRRALCETEIDRILLEQVSISSRSVAVTDTRELEKKRLERRKAAETNRLAKVSRKLSSKAGSGIVESKTIPAKATGSSSKKTEEKDNSKGVEKRVDVAVQLDWARDMFRIENFEEVEKALLKVLRAEPENFKGRYMMALVRIRQAKFNDAQVVIEDLLEDYGRNEGVLLLSSGLYAATQQYAKAMTMLDKALKLNPARPHGYLNMAWLLLEMNPRELDDPEMYYRRSVELGGPRDRELEKRLGIKQS